MKDVVNGEAQGHDAESDSGSDDEHLVANPVVEDLIEGIPLDDESKATVIRRLELMQGQFSSPVPPPFIMKEHAEVLPSAPERILSMAERQSAHRQSLEKMVMKGADIRAYIGQGCALLVAVMFGYWSYDLIRGGAEVAGAVLGTVDLVGLVSVFLVGRQEQRRNAERPTPPVSENPRPELDQEHDA